MPLWLGSKKNLAKMDQGRQSYKAFIVHRVTESQSHRVTPHQLHIQGGGEIFVPINKTPLLSLRVGGQHFNGGQFRRKI